MKNKDTYIKRVYRKVVFKGGYWLDENHSLGKDFYSVCAVAECTFGRFKVEYYDRNLRTYVVAWKDKHDNVVVRYMPNVEQTKIDFENV